MVAVSTTTTVSRLLAARRRAKLTQLQLAARAGVSVTTVSLAERFGALSSSVAAKLAPILGVEPEELLPEELLP